MKLRKQSRVKATIAALAAGLFLLFLGLIKSNPQINAEATAPDAPQPDYERFFAPGASRETPNQALSETSSAGQPHTRTRAS